MPEHVANDAIKETLRAWDVSRTDAIATQIEVGWQHFADPMLEGLASLPGEQMG